VLALKAGRKRTRACTHADKHVVCNQTFCVQP
jgi:hypothetical protein